MSSGAKQTTPYGVESAPGVIATTWKTLAFTSNGLDAAAQTTESQTIKDGRIASGSLVTGIDVTGDIETELLNNFSDFKSARNVEVFSIEKASAEKVFDRYFSGRPPFSIEKNKEFADAFVLESLLVISHERLGKL